MAVRMAKYAIDYGMQVSSTSINLNTNDNDAAM